MAAAGIILLAIGSVGVCGAVLLEMKYREPIYRVLMKVFPWLIGLGSLLLGVGLRGG